MVSGWQPCRVSMQLAVGDVTDPVHGIHEHTNVFTPLPSRRIVMASWEIMYVD